MIFGTLLAESKLPDNFDRQISSLEAKVEKQDYTKFMVTRLLEMYNQGANHYDKMNQVEYGDVYRQRIMELMQKPDVMKVLQEKETQQNLRLEAAQLKERSKTFMQKPNSNSGMFPEVER